MYLYELLYADGRREDTCIRFKEEVFKKFLLRHGTRIEVFKSETPREKYWQMHIPHQVDEFRQLHPDAVNMVPDRLALYRSAPQASFVLRHMPKIILIGHARHGKDTVAELMGRKYGFRWIASSAFSTERIMMPFFNDMGPEWSYETPEECHADRVNHRAMWYEQIKAWNYPDLTRMTRTIFSEGYDMSVGMRNNRELWACKNAGVGNFVLWVDASERHPAEDKSSCTVEPWMADFIIDNNGSLDDMERSLDVVMQRINVSVLTS